MDRGAEITAEPFSAGVAAGTMGLTGGSRLSANGGGRAANGRARAGERWAGSGGWARAGPCGQQAGDAERAEEKRGERSGPSG